MQANFFLFIIINYMYITISLAHILGIFFAVLGLSIFLNKKGTSVAIDEIFENKGCVWIVGLITLILGSIIVGINNFRNTGLSLFIDILGWATLLKGSFILLFPNLTISYYKKMNKGNIFSWGGFIAFILGLILLLQ